MISPGARLRNPALSKRMKSSAAMKTLRPLALAALALTGACSTLRYEPTANWIHDGGRLCAQDREPLFWDGAAPRACPQTFSENAPAPGPGK
jgi:hypothetical protein